ncbi:restriction endonuclease subunit S [Dyella japonica]|uniref:Type I restriction enzyme S subunit n=1 Tax=Dyella japonica TaxID=231455 RepID=A0ABV2JN86_9GAMM
MSVASVAKIGDLCEQLRGVTYSKDDVVMLPRPGFKPVLRANNITDNGLTFDDLVFVPQARVGIRQFIKKHDVVIAASSGSIEVVGKAARALEDFDGGFGAFCKVLRPNKKVDPGYFSHFFQTKSYRQRISQLAAGANINNLRNEHLTELEIFLPPLSEQRRIAAILDKADALRVKRREAIAKLDQLLQSVFLDMFGDPVTNPMGWPQKELFEICDPNDRINYGVVQPGDHVDDGVPLIRVGDIEGGRLDLASVKRIDPAIDKMYGRSRLNGNELLVTCVGSIGGIASVPPAARGYNIARAITRVPLLEPNIRSFVRECLRTPSLQRYFLQKTRTVSQPTLNVSFVKSAPIISPPAPLVAKFCEVASAAEGRVRAMAASGEKMAYLLKSLQQKAFSGQLARNS